MKSKIREVLKFKSQAVLSFPQKRESRMFLIGLLFWGMMSISWAGTIQLRLSASVDMNPELLWAKIKITNRGNEAAREVHPTVWIQNRPYRLNGMDELPAGQTLQSEYRTNKRHPFQEPGLYYLPMHIGYRDQNGFRFQLPYLIKMIQQEEKPAGLKWKVSQIVLPDDDTVQVTLTNTDSFSKTIHLSQIMAMKIKLELPQSPFVLKAKESQTWKLKIRHDTIWPNTYISYLIAEYSHQGYHHSRYTPLNMKVVPESIKGTWLFERQWMLTALIVLTVIAVAGGYGPIIYRKLWQKHS